MPLPNDSAPRHVLVVEDEPVIADSIAARLRAERFTVTIAGDGPSAVEAARERQPDLVVLDVMLPGFDGLEVCRRIQAERAVPVLMLTARDDETDVLVGLSGKVATVPTRTTPSSCSHAPSKQAVRKQRGGSSTSTSIASTASAQPLGRLELST